MRVVGHVESLWRYPVKSMGGEELHEAFAGFSGIYGDRLYAFRSSAAPKGFPFFTGREQEQLLLCRARYQHPDRMAKPSNLAEAEAMPPGVTPVAAEPADRGVDVETPTGERFAIDDPQLISLLRGGSREAHQLTLLRSDRAMTDCRPIALFSIQTARQLGRELGSEVDKRRFRSNVYADLESGEGFGEDELVGRRLRLGAKAVIAVVDRDPRCKMITLDPETGQANPEIMRLVTREHDGNAGVYAAVVVEGTIKRGDEIVLLD